MRYNPALGRSPQTRSFPLMRDLPPLLETAGWTWCTVEVFDEQLTKREFWLGTDRHGNHWLTKLTGGFCAYREIVFGRIAQQMGWSCQSSVFMRLDGASAEEIGAKSGEIHAAHWFLKEHAYPPCNEGCRLAPLVGKSLASVEDIVDLPVAHIFDWPKSHMAACLFGGNEPPGKLFTMEHEFVIIDSERMFATDPCAFDSTIWWGDKDTPRSSGVELAKEVCIEFLALGKQSLNESLSLPKGVSVQEMWSIKPLLDKSFAFAKDFVRSGTSTVHY